MTYTVCGKAYPVSDYARDRDGFLVKNTSGSPIPIVDIHMLEDVKWQRIALEQRLRNPEDFASRGEDVPAMCEAIRAWLRENDPEYEEA